MKIVKFTHSCVRLEKDGRVLVIDPGAWSEPRALRGADAVLVTHEHIDHADDLRLAGVGSAVYGPPGADLRGVRHIPLQAGETVEVAGFRVLAVGARHSTVSGGHPNCAHLGYVVDDLYHPGDSVHPPGVPVTTLLVPVHGSWLRLGDAIDLLKAVDPMVAIGIHEGQLNERGLESVNAWLAESHPSYRYLSPGSSVSSGSSGLSG